MSKDIFGKKTDGSYYIKTVYRNGKTEEANLNLADGVENPEREDKMTLFYQRYDDYISQGWDILPAQNEPVI